jgi:hypothetical protein
VRVIFEIKITLSTALLIARYAKGAIGCSHLFLGSLDAGDGGPESHRAMQKPTTTFHLMAHIVSREPKGQVDWYPARQ